MAIQPIDLQAIFSQIDKVAKAQIVQREGQHIQEILQQAQSQRRLEENVQSVNESQDLGEETGKIKDEQGHGASANQGGAGGNQEEPEEAAADNGGSSGTIRDPALGRNVDISG